MCDHELLTKIYDTVCTSDNAFFLECINSEKNTATYFYFRQIKLGTGKIIYCNATASRFVENWFNNVGMMIFGILSAEKKLYLAGHGFFNIWDLLTNEEDLPDNILLLQKWIEHRNVKIMNETFKPYYESLEIHDIPSSKETLLSLCKQEARHILLGGYPIPEMKDICAEDFFTEHEYMAILCGLWDFDDAVAEKLSKRKNTDIATKSHNRKILEFVQSKEVCEPWEFRIAEALRSLKAELVAVEFSVNGFCEACKIYPDSVLTHLIEKKRFYAYESRNITNLIRTLVKESGKRDLTVSCENISKIIYGKNVLYEAQAEEPAQNEEGS